MMRAEAERLHNEGVQLLQDNQVEQAMERFVQAITADPSFALPYYDLASVLYSLEKLEEALHLFHQAEEKGLHDADVYFMLGLGYKQKGAGHLARALAYFQLAVEKQPEDHEALFQKGLCAAELGHLEQAVQDFQQVIARQPEHADAHYNLGVASAYLGQVDQALVHLERAVTIQPDHLLAHYAKKQVKGWI